MNKKIAAFFTDSGMTVTNNRAYGIVNGYEVSAFVKTLDYVDPVKIHISFYATDEQKNKICSEIGATGVKRITRYGMYLGFNGVTAGSVAKKLPDIFKTVFAALERNGAVGFGHCPVCGNATAETAVKKCNIDGFDVTMDEGCVQSLNNELSELNAQFDNAPNNYGKGFAGALIGGVVGGLVAGLLYAIGFVSAWSAIIAVILGAFLYQKFGGKPNKMMILIVSVTAIVCMLIAFIAVYLIATRIALDQLGLLSMSTFDGFALVMQDSEFANMFYTDLALLIGFSLLGIGLMIFQLGRKYKRKKNIEQ